MHARHIAELVGLVLIASGCGRRAIDPVPNEEKRMATPSDSATGCIERIRTLVVAGDLSAGTGLTTACRRADAEQALGIAGQQGSGRLSGMARSWVKYAFGKDSVARVWTADDDDLILLIDVAHPPVRETPAALRARLGEPTVKFPGRSNPSHEEWIYADRGLTITVGAGWDDPPDHPKVTYLFVYAPTTLDDYVGALGGKDEWIIRRPPR